MDYKEISIFTTSAGIDPVAALLEDCGIEGYVLEDAADFEEFLQDAQIYWDYMDEELVAQKTSQETCLKVYVTDDAAGRAQYAAVLQGLERMKALDQGHTLGRLETAIAVTKQEDWEWGWKQYFKPFPVGDRFLIKPSWEQVQDAGGRTILEIDPASSFGTGTHDTTQLCIKALEHRMQSGDAVLDMGTGSGILAIAAAMLGGEVKTIVDIDTNCIKTAHENAQKNGVSLGHGVCGDLLRDASLRAQLEQGYDLILANIVADVIIGMRTLFWDKLKQGGTLICSGILNERASEVEQALRAQGFTIYEHNRSDDWSAFVAGKE